MRNLRPHWLKALALHVPLCALWRASSCSGDMMSAFKTALCRRGVRGVVLCRGLQMLCNLRYDRQRHVAYIATCYSDIATSNIARVCSLLTASTWSPRFSLATPIVCLHPHGRLIYIAASIVCLRPSCNTRRLRLDTLYFGMPRPY